MKSNKNKKLQVFISSTFKDLQDERQAAVEAILSAGHIPAGMELFKAGNDSQLDVIKQWIDESDVYMLILGGRYGTIEPNSGKSYTHLEYEYAIKTGKPVFAVVMNKSALDEKLKAMSSDAIEMDNQTKYNGFKDYVTSKICKFFDDVKDIKIAIHETLNDFDTRYTLHGWVSGKDMQIDVNGLNQEIVELQRGANKLKEENRKLKEENEKLIKQPILNADYNGYSYDELKQLLKNEKVTFDGEPSNLLTYYIKYSDMYMNGKSSVNFDALLYLIYQTGKRCIKYGLMEEVTVNGVINNIQTTKKWVTNF
ncbi:hypothetical protein BRE01_62630 [Brevibacillus reuszeri]|uniref:DUF4062 domain-containing protein n=1 Tax=Brevibacillus reuszeri TaxID=54915 RepID=A0A0K9YW90_9BACL|nr:DUF4062 domain-containing protein [Brevibacillus reuszeri]KNB72948.1 hypothetical protein ADS79_14080 [Brevibacillus reuszeri]GED72561.1 hypothetical protein BRE01_62630 [Brevibacillus reuszeri]